MGWGWEKKRDNCKVNYPVRIDDERGIWKGKLTNELLAESGIRGGL